MSKYKSVTLMESFRDAAEEMTDAELAAFTRAVINYGFDEVEPESLPRSVLFVFRSIQAQIKAGWSMRDGGKQGGRPPKTEKGVNPTPIGVNPIKTGVNPITEGVNPTPTGVNPTETGITPGFTEEKRIEENRGEENRREEKRGDSAQARASASAKPPKHFYGCFKNVLLTDEEHQKLAERFPYDLNDRIDELSEGIASKGYKYKNHYAAILSWARTDEKRAVEKAHDKITSINKRAAELKAQDDILEAWARGESNPDSRDFWEVTT